ncbi:MAG: S1 RNA-binding domain-containing protein, partial [Clostridia bacterium]|nr:S1 RNA-binding domain-containing protein [Clostridia bacterium]
MTSQEFFLALEELERTKGISKEDFIAALSNALTIAYRKYAVDAGEIEARLDPERKTVRFFSNRTVVEEVNEAEKEISLEDAKLIKKSYSVGDVVSKEINTKDFGRIAAQTAKQVVMQKLREVEHANTVSEFEDREGELMACTIRRIEDGNVYVEIGGNQIEGVLLPREQVPGEKYELNQRLNVYVKRVKNAGRSAQIVVSRTANGL